MCGIAGYFVNRQVDGKSPNPKLLGLLAQNLMEGIETRGRDATGYAFVSQADKFVKLGKAPVNASAFLELGGHLLSKAHTPKSMPQMMLLHTRAATKGEPANNWNNHPIYSKETGLCLIHNGWLINDDELVAEHKLRLDAQVDSEAYLRVIEKFYLRDEKKSVENAIAAATGVAFGSIACAMIQAGRRGTLWLWRDEGPISLAQTDWGWVFASTTAILSKAMLSTQGSFPAIDMSFFKVGEVSPRTLLKFQLGSPVRKFTFKGVRWDRIPEKIGSRVTTWDVNGKKQYRRRSDNTPYTNATTTPVTTIVHRTTTQPILNQWRPLSDYDNYARLNDRIGRPFAGTPDSPVHRSQSTGYGSTFLPGVVVHGKAAPDNDTGSGAVGTSESGKKTESSEGTRGEGAKSEAPKGTKTPKGTQAEVAKAEGTGDSITEITGVPEKSQFTEPQWTNEYEYWE